MLGFHEPRLDDHIGSVVMCANYWWKVSNIMGCMNTEALRSLGGPQGWVMAMVTGDEALAKLLDGPSYMASHLFQFEVLPAVPRGKEYLIAELSTIEKQLSLLGFIPGYPCKGPQALLPTLHLLHHYLKGFHREWTPDAEALMTERWEAILEGEVKALTADKWQLYIAQFNANEV